MSKSILARRIAEVMEQHARPMSIQEIGLEIPEKPLSSIRGRLYRELSERCKRVARGVYMYLSMDEAGAAIVVEGNGRDLSAFDDGSIDAIVTDHPWECESNVGTNRRFDSGYEETVFRYKLEDFKEKARVLKDGGFLVEMLPAENEKNFKYLYEIKIMAEECGLQYYSLIRWKKGIRVFNTGRCSKNSETVMFCAICS